MLADPVTALIILCAFSKRDAVKAKRELTKAAIPIIPKITPAPKTKIKTKPNSTELTTVKVTTIRAALPPSPCKTPVSADLCKCVCPLLESVKRASRCVCVSSWMPFRCILILSAISGLTTSTPKMTSITPPANSNKATMLSGITARRVRTSSPTRSNMIEWPAPQAVAEMMDLRRLVLLQISAETATTWSGSRECPKPNANPVRGIRIGVKSTASETWQSPSNTFLCVSVYGVLNLIQPTKC